MDLADILAGMTPDGDAWHVDAPEGWSQGRALYGGLAAALCLAAAKRATPGLPPLRAVQATYLAPAPGALRLVPTPLRAGRSATMVSVDLFAADTLAVRVAATFGAARDSAIGYDRVPMPPVPAPQDAPPIPPGAPRPDFFPRFDVRVAGGAAPMSRAASDEILMWARFAGAAGDDPEVALLAIADLLPPAASVSFSALAPISTVAWHVDVAQPVTATPWYLVRSLGEQAGDGYSRQAMACWAADGRCLATGRQTVALFA